MMVFFSAVIEELLFGLFNFHSTDSTEGSVRGKDVLLKGGLL